MNRYIESLAQLFGRTPRKPRKNEISSDAQKIYFYKKGVKVTKAELVALHDEHHKNSKNKWRKRRWLTLVLVNLLFVLSFSLDIQLLEGALTASRFAGFHMADLNSALQVMLAHKTVLINLLIGIVTIFIMWFLLGGRTFCSWVCPYHLVAEWAEMLHLWFAKRGWAKDYTFHRGVRAVFYVLFALMAIITGYTVYEFISPTGILSRAIIYGPTLALVWVALLLLFEIFLSRRAWCRYVCPIGITYGIVGVFSPLRVTYDLTDCKHEGDCRNVCLVPHVLDLTIKNRSTEIEVGLGADCTRCGLCIDACPTSSLNFEFVGLTHKPEKDLSLYEEKSLMPPKKTTSEPSTEKAVSEK
ncbi:NapH/MauN family ferredoxin-type protein [sulfur-oxidizing endosymbiont of Gigantopelta aegis]|uniref:NapH/MauN family ferredoxin-type protein n=1 Tax=sulfur-oxidizing endosymbiont of Gigantopelta aegis TaxID=2794934 RepID=UPI0018DB85B6|nr:NapH/MauN family ferredoxin-type protein [sulfur-oxidizing endosymbiont of Gigantopelta aegis]